MSIALIAGRVCGEVDAGGRKKVDPTVIVAIITALLQLFGKCNLNSFGAEQRARNVAAGKGLGHRLDRIRLRRTVEQHLRDDSEAEEVEAALLDAVDSTSSAEFAAAFAEANP